MVRKGDSTNRGPSCGVRGAQLLSATPKREVSKQAILVELMSRPEGATLAQMVQATGWQAHTVRGCLAGTLKKKLGLLIDSVKETGGERVYRVSPITTVCASLRAK